MPKNLVLFDHQKHALKEWFNQGGKGILEMATGTGKTKTALSAAVKLYEGLRSLAVVVICPYKHLLSQWNTDCREFGLHPILGFENKKLWIDELNRCITAYNIGSIRHFSLITTNKTFQSPDMQKLLRRLRKNTLIIADEMHNLGAEKLRSSLPDNINYRLGLSATPKRYFDPVGTEILMDYFGRIIFRYTLKEGIENNILTKYKYYPHLIQLTETESEEYHELSCKIAKLVASDVNEDAANEAVKALLIKRARLIAGAKNKLPSLYNLVKKDLSSKHNLFYCGDGTVENEITNSEARQIDAVLCMLGNQLNMNVHPFTSRESPEVREMIKRQFIEGTLQGLVAIRCLDEGVDIPATKTAYILASSSNPKQFIQRRGRLLRKHKGKQYAIIHDFITIPIFNDGYIDDHTFNIERSLIKKELNRFAEFSALSINEGEALGRIRAIKRSYNLFDI